MNSVDIKIAKPLDEGQWAAGYTAELMSAPMPPLAPPVSRIRQAYVELRARRQRLGPQDGPMGQPDRL